MRGRVAILVLILTAAACGGGSTTTTASGPTTLPIDNGLPPPGGTGTTTDPFAAPSTTLPDLIAPELLISDPLPGAMLDTDEYVFSGRTEPGARVVANGEAETFAAQDGRWSLPVMLVEGENTVTIAASDAAGNTTVVEITVFSAPVPEGPCGTLPNTLLPPDVEDATEVSADLDGDGEDDLATVYRTDEWRLHVRLAYGWGVERPLTSLLGDALPPAEAVAALDLGGPVVLVLLGGTQQGESYAFFALDGCRLLAAEQARGGIPPLTIGSGDDATSWFTCRPDGVSQFTVERIADTDDTLRVREWDYMYDPAVVGFTLTATADDEVAGSLEDVTNRLQAGNPSCI